MNQQIFDRVLGSFERQGLMGYLGAELASVELGRVEIHLPFKPGLSQQNGFFHAGSIASVIDSAGGYAGYTYFEPGEDILAVEFKLNLIAPANGDLLIAVGEVVKSGKTLTVTRGDVFVESEGERKLCAVMQQTLIRIRPRT